jgi:hypothetical protein
METPIDHPENKEQLTALEDKASYNPEFVEMIKQGDEDLKAGKGIEIDVDNLWK